MNGKCSWKSYEGDREENTWAEQKYGRNAITHMILTVYSLDTNCKTRTKYSKSVVRRTTRRTEKLEIKLRIIRRGTQR
jgi:hypothetical protein